MMAIDDQQDRCFPAALPNAQDGVLTARFIEAVRFSRQNRTEIQNGNRRRSSVPPNNAGYR